MNCNQSFQLNSIKQTKWIHTPSPIDAGGQNTASAHRSSAWQTASMFQTCPVPRSRFAETATNNQHTESSSVRKKEPADGEGYRFHS